MASSSRSAGLSDAEHDPSTIQNYSMNSKIIIISLAVLFLVVFVVVVLHAYAKWCWRSSAVRERALSRLRSSLSSFQEAATKAGGLDREVVQALPIFAYTPPSLPKGAAVSSVAVASAAKPAECAVCLAEFRQGESCKLLPICRHFFHLDCIDLWFLSHSTCPLCRATPGSPVVDEEAGYPAAFCAEVVMDEETREAQGGRTWHVQGWRNGMIHGDEEQGAGDGDMKEDSLLCTEMSAQTRRWRRSVSDKFPSIPGEAAGVLSWSSHSSHRSPVGGRSLSFVAFDSLKPQQTLVAVSSCPSISGLISPTKSILTKFSPSKSK